MSLFLKTISDGFARLVRDRRGAAAVEFAFLAPVAAALFLGVFDVGKIVYDRTDLHSAVRSGAQYFMAGGDDLAEAAALVEASWTNRPEVAQVGVEECCECAGEDAPCGELCPDGGVPDLMREVSVTAYFPGLFGTYEVNVSETVRAR